MSDLNYKKLGLKCGVEIHLHSPFLSFSEEKRKKSAGGKERKRGISFKEILSAV